MATYLLGDSFNHAIGVQG